MLSSLLQLQTNIKRRRVCARTLRARNTGSFFAIKNWPCQTPFCSGGLQFAQRKDAGNEMKMLKHEPRQCNWPIGFLAIRQEAVGLADGHACGRSYVEAVGRSLTSVKFSFALLAFFHLGERRKVTSGRPQTISLFVRQAKAGRGSGRAWQRQICMFLPL